MVVRTTAFVTCIALLCLPIPSVAQNDAPENSSWHFENWSLPATLPWTTYRDTFLDIPATEDPVSSAFDVVFYDGVYRGLSNLGNCFGMSLMSLMMIRDGGHLGFCLPINQFSGDLGGSTGPTDPNLATAINIMHGHQVNLPGVQFQLNIFANHNNRDGAYVFDQFNYWKSRGDYTLISVTKDLNPQDGGHTLIAYKAVDQGAGNRQIFVYDPNRPFATNQSWYQGNQNFVQINGHNWSFDMTIVDGTFWSGSPSSGGNLVITPISVVGPDSRSPASLGDQIIGQLVSTLLLSGQGAKLQQITDDHGKRLFKPGTLKIDTDPATGMRNTVPIFLSDQGRSKPQGLMLMHFGTSGGALHVTVDAGESGYALKSIAGRTIVAVSARGGKGAESVTLRYPTTREPAVILNNVRNTEEYNVEFVRAEVPRMRVNLLTLSHLKAATGVPVELGLANKAHAIRITSPRASTQYDIQLRTVTRSGQDVLTKNQVSQEAGTVHLVEPEDWKNLKAGGVSEQMHRIPNKVSAPKQ